MASILIFLLILAIFCAACFFVVGLIPDPFRKWAIAILVVIGAIIAISWLSGGNLGSLPSLHR